MDVSLALWPGDQPILCSGRLRKTALGGTVPFSYALRRPYPSFQSQSSSSSPFLFRHLQCHCFPALEGYFHVFIFPGVVIGQGLNFRGEQVQLLPISTSHLNGDDDLNAPSIKFQVVRALGTGSYAVVYQVRQILSGYPPQAEDLSPINAVNFDDLPSPAPVKYGREYALKCLSKADLDKDALSTRMFEVCPSRFPLYTCSPNCRFEGNDSPISAYPPEHCHPLSYPRNPFLPPFTSRIRPRPRPLYFLEQSCDYYEPEPPSSPSAESRTPPLPRAFCLLQIQTNYSRVLAYDSSPLCSPRCVKLSPPVIRLTSSTGTSNLRTLSLPTVGLSLQIDNKNAKSPSSSQTLAYLPTTPNLPIWIADPHHT